MFFLSKKKKHFSDTHILLKKLQDLSTTEDFVDRLSARRIRLNTFTMYVKNYDDFMGFLKTYTDQEHLFKTIKIKEEKSSVDFDYFVKDVDISIQQSIEELYIQISKFLYKAGSSPDNSTHLTRLIKDSKSLIEHADFALGA